ncbi:MAG: hypothetical protein LBK99_19760 [Opitutaceae bacterium]|nr:hypothetical protein [Opitutaceae bacterium]
MKTTLAALAALAISLSATLPATGADDSLLKVDFDDNAHNATQSGFVPWALSSSTIPDGKITGSFSVTSPLVQSNKIDVAVGGGLTSANPALDNTGAKWAMRDRVAANGASISNDFAAKSLYRDVLFLSNGGGSNATVLFVQFSSLLPSTTYSLTFYSVDVNDNSTTTLYDLTANSGNTTAAGSVSYTGSSGGGTATTYDGTTPFDIVAIHTVATADADGKLLFKILTASTSNQAMLNGFEIHATAVPEPATCAVILAAGCLLVGLTCRQKNRRRAGNV